MIVKEKKSLIYWLTLFLLLSSYLVFLFKPHYYVTFDSEPDYLANAFHILKWGIPWGGHHPGTLVQYLYSEFLRFFIYIELELNQTIILLRIIYFFIFLLILFFSSRLLKSKKNIFFKYCLVLSLLFPIINFHFSHFGIELILFSSCLLLWCFFYKNIFYKNGKDRYYLIAILLGLTISLKLSAIVLIFFYYLIILLFFNEKIKFKFYLIFKTSLISFLTFVLFTIPSIRYYPKLFNKIKRQLNFDLISLTDLISILILFLLITVIFFIFYYFNHSKIINFFNKNKEKIFTFVIYIFLAIIIFRFLNYENQQNTLDYYFSLPSYFRNFIPIIPIFFLFLYHKRIILNNYLIILLSIINITLFTIHFYEKKSIIDDLILKNKHENLVIFSDSTFNSKYYFLEFTKSRWGNNKIDFPQKWKNETNLSFLSNDIYKLWAESITKKNLSLSKKEKEKENKNLKLSLYDYLKNSFKSKKYNYSKFKLIGLTKPRYNSRILFDHCPYLVNTKIMFDLNYTDKKNLIYFDKSIDSIQKKCNIKLKNNVNINNVSIYEFK